MSYLQLKNTLHNNGAVPTGIAVMLATGKNSSGTKELHDFDHQRPKRFIVITYIMAEHTAPAKAKETICS